MDLSRSRQILVGALILGVAVAAGCTKTKPTAGVGTTVVGDAPSQPGGDPAKRLKPDQVLEVPFIFWGGDVAAFHANGGLETTPDSLFAKQGLKVKLTPGDDFGAQVKNYKDNKTPFLRGTMSMIGQAADDLTKTQDTTPVVFLQMTWSAGDHLVGRPSIKTLNDLKGKRIALQEGGPHVGMLNDILNTVKLTWADIAVVWTKDLGGEKGPAERFRTDLSVDACFAVSPDMFELTSAPADSPGITSTGDGKGKSVKGARVVVSTAHMARSIADVYAVRKDFYDANKDHCEKFAAAYIKACEELVDVKKKSPEAAKADPTYKKMVKLAQDIWGKDAALKDLVGKYEDVDGLISDANFVGLPGNESFFKQEGNLSGFKFKMAQAVALPGDPSRDGLRSNPGKLLPHDMNYAAIRKIGDLHGKAPPPNKRINAEDVFEKDQTIYEFIITFEPDDTSFSEEKYGKDFQRALEQASLFGNAVVAVRGHADPSAMVGRFISAATAQGILKNGMLNGKKFDPNATQVILQAIKDNPGLQLQEPDRNGRMMTVRLSEAVKNLQGLSEDRAKNVRDKIVSYSSSRGLILDQSQLRSVGVGVTDPVIGFARTVEEGQPNRRVQFMIVKVPADKVDADEFKLE